MLKMNKKPKAKKVKFSECVLINPEKVFGGSQDSKGGGPRSEPKEETETQPVTTHSAVGYSQP